MRDSQNLTRKLVEMINKFSSVAGYGTNMHKTITFLYTNNTHTEEIMDTILFIVTPK